MTQDQHVLLVASKAFTITGPCWCLVEDSDYLPDLTLKHQTACSRGMLGWMVLVDDGQPSHWNKAPVPASAMGSGGCAAAAYIHALLFVAQPSACPPACRNTTVWTRPETPGVAFAVHTGRASGRGPRATLNATRRIRPRSRQFSCHDQSDCRRHLRDSTRHVIASFQLFMVE